VDSPLTSGTDTLAPIPFATALAATVPVGVILAVAPVTLDMGMLGGSVTSLGLASAVVGVPDILTVTTVPFAALTAVAAVSPGGKLETVKSAAVIDAAYVPLVSVYVIVTALPILRPTVRPVVSPAVAETAMAGTGAAAAVLMAALTRAVPSL